MMENVDDGAALQSVQVALHDHLLGRPSTIADDLREGGRIGITQRLGIYHHAYRARLLEAMQDSFEKTWAYLGDEQFAAAATAFIETHPPRHRNLRWYGADFAAWLANEYPADLDIGELAAIDWGLRNAFDGADAEPVTAAMLVGLSAADWQEVGCRFVPTLTIEAVRYNTAAIWHALDRGEVPPPAIALDESRWLMIWRKEWKPHFRTIGTVEQAVLAKLLEGRPVAAVCADIEASFGDEGEANTVGALLRGWVNEELICEMTGISRQPMADDASVVRQ